MTQVLFHLLFHSYNIKRISENINYFSIITTTCVAYVSTFHIQTQKTVEG